MTEKTICRQSPLGLLINCGIGRGADLIFYCWVVIGLLLTLGLHLRIRAQGEAITELVRELAILRAEQADANRRYNS